MRADYKASPQMTDGIERFPLPDLTMRDEPVMPPESKQRGATLMKRGLNYFHEALADYLLINPGATLREIGSYFGYTPSWICQVVNSDMFQAYLGDRRKGITTGIDLSLPEKMRDAAAVAIERLVEIAGTTRDEELAVDASDKILARAGYGPNSKTGTSVVNNTQNNTFLISRGDLAQARESFIQGHANGQVQASAERDAGEIPTLPATVHNSEEEPR